MSAVAVAWLVSILGALLFTAAGYLAAAARRTISPERKSTAPPFAEELHDTLRTKCQSLEREIAALRTHGDTLHEDNDRLRAEADRTRAEVDKLRVENERLRASAATDKSLAASELAELRRAVERAQNERAELMAARDRHASEGRELRRERDELMAEIRRLRDDLEARDKHNRDLAMQLEVAQGRAVEVERLLNENAQLRNYVAEVDELRRQLAETRALLAQVRALEFAKARPPSLRPTARGTGATGDKTAALNAVLQSLSAGTDVRTVVVADGIGLPIAGLGDHVEALAALAGAVSGLIEKVKEFLPLSSARRVTLVDVNDMVVTMVPDPSGSSDLSLVTLSGAPGADANAVSRALADITHIVHHEGAST